MPSITYAFYSQSLQDELPHKPHPIEDAFEKPVLANIYRTAASKDEALKQEPSIPADSVYLGTIEDGALVRDTMPDILSKTLG